LGTQLRPLVLLALTQPVPAELLAGEHGAAERASAAECGPAELLPQPGCPGCPALPAAHPHCWEAPQTHDWYGLGVGARRTLTGHWFREGTLLLAVWATCSVTEAVPRVRKVGSELGDHLLLEPPGLEEVAGELKW